jgi:hypothetical protein
MIEVQSCDLGARFSALLSNGLGLEIRHVLYKRQ